MAISIIKQNILTKAHKFFDVSFIFLLLLIKHRKGRHKWANFRILQLGWYPTRQLILLKSLYWIFHLLPLFPFLTFRVYDLEYSYGFDDSLLLCPSYFSPLSFCSFGGFYSELHIVYFHLHGFSCRFCLLVYFRKVFRTFYLDLFLYIHVSSQAIYSLIIPYPYCIL